MGAAASERHMNTNRNNIEIALEDLAAADRAGVFRRTPMPSNVLFSPKNGFGGYHVIAHRLRYAIAASLLLAVAVWGWMFSSTLSSLKNAAGPHQQLAANDSGRHDDVIAHCLLGPLGSKSDPCWNYDYDQDGDVDLADFSKHQVASASKPSPY